MADLPPSSLPLLLPLHLTVESATEVQQPAEVATANQPRKAAARATPSEAFNLPRACATARAFDQKGAAAMQQGRNLRKRQSSSTLATGRGCLRRD